MTGCPRSVRARLAVGRRAPAPPVNSSDFALWRPTAEFESLEVEPRLASWDARSHPSQVRLQSYLDGVEAVFARHLRESSGLFYIDVEVVRPPDSDLLHHHDIENYLTPIAQRLRKPHPFMKGLP